MADTQFTVAGGWGGSLSTRYGLASRYPDSKEKPAHWPPKSTLSPESVVDTPGPRGSQPPKIPLYGSQVFKSTSLQESSHTQAWHSGKLGGNALVELCVLFCLPQKALLLSDEVLVSIFYLWNHSLSISVLLALTCLGNSFWVIASNSYFTLGWKTFWPKLLCPDSLKEKSRLLSYLWGSKNAKNE